MPPKVMAPSLRAAACELERDDELPSRYCPPVHYVVEIKSVSELLETDKYEFGVFEAGDYKWSLCLYPKGDEDNKGSGYMSLYLSIKETDDLGDDWAVVVDYKFFVFNNLNHKYIIFKEKDNELREFHGSKTRWGLSKFLALRTFNNTEAGYRKGEYCKLGAELLVSKPERKKETLTIIKDPSSNKITIKIQGFSTVNENPQYSDPFSVGGSNWKLKVFPRDRGGQEGKSLSVYLEVLGLPKRSKIYARAKLCVLSHKGHENNKEKTVRSWLRESKSTFGSSGFMPWGDLEKSKGWLVNKNELQVEVQFLVIYNIEADTTRIDKWN